MRDSRNMNFTCRMPNNGRNILLASCCSLAIALSCRAWVWGQAADSATTPRPTADGVDPRRPAAIETQDVPVVPPELFRRLAQYQSVRGAAFRGWSPDGQGILISTRFANSSQLHRVSQPEGRREQITFEEEPVGGVFIPAATDGAIVLTMDRGGNENGQLLLLDRQRFTTMLLTDGKSRNLLQTFRADGSKAIVSSNQRNGRDMDLYLFDPRKAGFERCVLEVDRQTLSVLDWSRDGRTLLLERYVSINETYPSLLDLETGKQTDLPRPSPEVAAYGAAAFAPDGKSVYIATDAGAEFRRLGKVDLATGKYTWLTADIAWDVTDVKVEPRSGDVAVAVNEDGATGLYFFAKGSAQRKQLKLPLGIISGLEFSPDGQQLGFTLSRPDAPPDAYSLRLADEALTRWTISEVGGLDPASFVAPARIQFPSFDDRAIPAYYFRPRDVVNPVLQRPQPPAKRRLPVLISIHGGPESQYQPFFLPLTQFYVNELGIAVIYPNVRGSAGYGKTYLKLDNAEKREDAVRDIGALLDWIAKQPDLDSERVAVIGGSYGGFMVLSSLTHYGSRIRAGIDIVGIANFLTFLEKTASYRVDLRRAEYGDERDEAMRAKFVEISPLNHADKIESALMVVHGKNDPRVPFFEAEQIAAKVRARGRPVWSVFANNEGHGFSKKDNADYQRAVEVMFLRQHLGLDAASPRTP